MRIAILDDYQNAARGFADWDRLERDHGAEITVFDEYLGAGDDEVVAALDGFDAVVAMRERTPFTAARLARLPKLGLIVSTGRRNASIDLAAAHEHGVVVSHTGYLPSPAAEHTWALILAAVRRLDVELGSAGRGWTADAGWQRTVGRGLEGRTLGVLGLGNLGARVARVGLAFGMDVIAWSEHLTAERASEHGVRRVEKEELFAAADILTVHLVLSRRTRGLVGEREFALMKPDAIFVNTSRGPIADEHALIAALEEDRIGMAALDVFDTEPLPAGHPLRLAPRTVLTPHIGYVTREQYEVFYRDAVEGIAAWAAGRPIRVMEG
ncbi:D-2-hydroxyacid dehydrogenase family protein [Agromyces archimandritae]|uniref:D-2-hydroxyacid dehydrogenase family protein n=1 Tax=Agromyces archimandritae TaxID=2781962 RepID=A0A975INL0_9MICO|nr:D-2-hydroxyacid dehydrogenase family protein [Agromyces archimandritae]QTX04718.1 D-2-hydroxyacid dehydrogenase family protein [Agromyces archimandritae]